jgi:hypothetical protein
LLRSAEKRAEVGEEGRWSSVVAAKKVSLSSLVNLDYNSIIYAANLPYKIN